MNLSRITDILLRAANDSEITVLEAIAVLAAINFCAQFTEEEAGNNGFGSAWIEHLHDVGGGK